MPDRVQPVRREGVLHVRRRGRSRLGGMLRRGDQGNATKVQQLRGSSVRPLREWGPRRSRIGHRREDRRSRVVVECRVVPLSGRKRF